MALGMGPCLIKIKKLKNNAQFCWAPNIDFINVLFPRGFLSKPLEPQTQTSGLISCGPNVGPSLLRSSLNPRWTSWDFSPN